MATNQESLGEVRRVFKPKPGNIAAGFILGAAMIGGGIYAAISIFNLRDPAGLSTTDWLVKQGFLVLVGVGLPALGLVLLVWMKRLLTHRVSVHERGFAYGPPDKAEICLWTDLTVIKEVFTEEELKVLKIPGGKIHNTDRSFIVVRRDDKEFYFDVNSIDSVPVLGEMLKVASRDHNIAWEQVHQ